MTDKIKQKKKVKKTIPELKRQAQEYLEGWQRSRAELDNYKKRQVKEMQILRQQSRADAVIGLLNLADNFRSVVKHVPKELTDNSWVQGVIHVAKQLDDVLAEQGVTLLDEVEVEFDPTRHEAAETIKDKNKQDGLVVELVQPGYLLGEQVLRPARVKVIKN